MKRLTLIRHAKSSWKDDTLTDFERPLNKRGRKAAPDMGERLAARDFRPDRMVSSPANRAFATARIIAEAIGHPEGEIAGEPRLYGASVEEILEVVRAFDDALEHVAIFGHNPGLTEAATWFTGRMFDNVPTAGVVDVRFDVSSWREVAPGRGELIDYDYPKSGREA
jgi:phosphohistidine phosphatase